MLVAKSPRCIDGSIALFVPDDARRITANWVEYAGGLVHGKADRRRSKDITPDNVAVNPERAVFDIETCLMVGRIRQERTRDYKGTIDYSVHIDSKAYPLSKLVYCAHCERIAIEHDNIKERTEIAHWRQRSKNADVLFYKARISEEEWRKLIEDADHEIARLQTQLTQGKEVEAAFLVNLGMITNLSQTWDQSTDDTRRAMANSLFEYLVYDLDTQRIVDFRMKPWAEIVMQLKITLEGDNKIPPNSGENTRVLACG